MVAWTYFAFSFGSRALNCPSTTRSTICSTQLPRPTGKCPGVAEQIMKSQPLSTEADPLQDGSFQVIIDEEVLDWKLLGCHLHFP